MSPLDDRVTARTNGVNLIAMTAARIRRFPGGAQRAAAINSGPDSGKPTEYRFDAVVEFDSGLSIQRPLSKE